MLLPAIALTQDAAPPNAAPAASKPNLANDQDAIRARFKRFNLTLQQMAEILRKQDPERADLLFRALGKSQETRIDDQMSLILSLLNKEQPQLGEAIERQEELLEQLKLVLELLQSEDRRSEIEKEKLRLQELVKDINKLLGKEKDIRAGTERGDDAKKLADKQAELEKQTDNLQKRVERQDAERNGELPNPKSPSKSADKSKGDKPDADGKKPDDKDADGKKDDAKKPPEEKKPDEDDKSDDKDKKKTDDKNGEKSKGDKPKDGSKPPMPSDKPMPGDKGKPKEGSQDSSPMPPEEDQPPKEGEQPEGDPKQDPKQTDPKKQQTPGRKELEQSREAMKRALEELKEKKREDASKEQDDAIRKLIEAKDKIEEILRQLREEEQKLMLAALEARFKKMLAMQLMIYHDTMRLSKAGDAEKSSAQARAVKLAQDENEIAIEAEKALILLKEEGSSIAFPEAVSGIRNDVRTLVGWLREAQVGDLTQAVEKDVIEALEELVEALQKEMEKADDAKKKQQQQQQQQQDGNEKPLVDQLGELKMLRSLQYRVNRRTKQLGRSFDGEQALKPEVVQQLHDLSGRQSRIQQATSDLVKGKNK
ncbi:MAG: hypothetical protein NT013_06890 [Planctomycetia bacterium]|nr:hypothetical protein [Planctomycetia bacterium]